MAREALTHTKTKIVCEGGRSITTIKETTLETEDDPINLATLGEFDTLDDDDDEDEPRVVPRAGHMVLYTLSPVDVIYIDRLRSERSPHANRAEAGQVYPMMIVRVWGETPESAVNGQVFLDGDDVLWVTSRTQGHDFGQFSYPED